jgi:glycosyltransferase involved in cell wall biosynthesis
LRIAFICSLLSRKAGGLYICVRQLAQALSTHTAIDIQVFGQGDEYLSEDRADWAPIEVFGLPVLGPKVFGFTPRLRDRLKDFSPDIVHFHSMWTYSSKGGGDYCRDADIPYVISPHGCLNPRALQQSRFKKWAALCAYEQANLDGATVLHALANRERDMFRQFGLKGPIAVIPNGIHVGARQPPLAPAWLASISGQKSVMLFLGRIHPIKGILNLIRAVGILKAGGHHGMDSWHFVIAGWGDGGHLAELRAETRKLGIEELFTFPGPLHGAEKDTVLSSANAFILPSYSEGLPLAVLEAWSWQIPTLITAACNLELAYHRGAAIKIDNDPAPLASELTKFFEMCASERAAVGRAGYDLAMEKFTWSEIASQMLKVYEWALNPGGIQAPHCLSIR